MRAKITVEFYGVEDGKIYPRTIGVGEVIEGDLAQVALREAWGVPAGESDVGTDAPPPPPAPGPDVEPAPEPVIEPIAAESPAEAPAPVEATPVAEPAAEPVSDDAEPAPDADAAEGVEQDVVEDDVVEIPDDWRDGHHKTIKALAKKITGSEPAKLPDAVKIIEAELARRAAE